jgi:hypothetical protein
MIYGAGSEAGTELGLELTYSRSSALFLQKFSTQDQTWFPSDTL